MQKNDQNISITRYKLNEYLGVYDSCSAIHRILYYRLGWHIFSKSNKTFKQYADFLRNRKRFKRFFLDWQFYTVIIGVFIVLILSIIIKFLSDKQVHWWVVVLVLFLLSLLPMVMHGIFYSTEDNFIQTEDFLSFINNKDKKSNFDFFKSMEIDDYESAAKLHRHFLAGRDLPVTLETNDLFNTTIKLLALDFLLGTPGQLQECVNLLVAKSEIKLSKDGIYKVFGKAIGTDWDNIKFNVESGKLADIRNYKNVPKQTAAKEAQLIAVKNIFKEAKLDSLANEVDKVLEKYQRA